MAVSDEHTAQGLYRQVQVAEAAARFDTVAKAVVGRWWLEPAQLNAA